jgi:nitroreductase
MFDLGMAAQNITLAAWEMGLGTVVVASIDHDRAAALLEVPAGYELLAFMPLGRPVDPEKKGPQKRDPGSFIHREKFQSAE